jgi:hypothetical protein
MVRMGTRLGIAALALGLAACDQPPVVEIVSPADGTLIDDHAAVAIDVVVTEEELRALTLELDGEPVSAQPDPPLPPDGDCGGGCAVRLIWTGSEASEGGHLLTVVALDEHHRGDAELGMTFEDTPTATLAVPAGANQVGVGRLGVTVGVVDRSPVTAEVRVDGVAMDGVTITGDCRFTCTVGWTWDTTTQTGEHLLEVTTTDPYGRAATVSQPVVLGDIPYATSIEVSGETDGPFDSRLEVEIHLEDAAGGHLGCAGEPALEGVDDNLIRYDVLAPFVDPSGNRISYDDLAGRDLEIFVMEDDTLPCPYAIDLGTDDIIGTSAAIPAEDLFTLPPQSFGNVVYLELTVGRPFTR